MNIPQRFRDRIWLHLARLDAKNGAYKSLLAPRILCIEGPPGVGKSVQLRQSLGDLGSGFVHVDASAFGGQFENDPVERLTDIVQGLINRHEAGAPRPSLVIDDFDLSLGKSGQQITYTVNNQLTTGWLMAMADENYGSAFDEASPAIFVTGNDLSTIHTPLLRPGRADHFKYEPSFEELRPIVEGILSETFGVAGKLVDIPKPHTIAWVLSVLTSIVDDKMISARRRGVVAGEGAGLIDRVDLDAVGFVFANRSGTGEANP